MKRQFILFSACFFTLSTIATAEQPEQIVGVWKSNNEDLIVKIDKVGDHFQGRIVWIHSDRENESFFDENNPDKRMTKMPLKGNKIIQELFFDPGKSAWIGGTFYSYKDGKYYKCHVRLENNDQIKIYKFREDNLDSTDGEEIWVRQ